MSDLKSRPVEQGDIDFFSEGDCFCDMMKTRRCRVCVVRHLAAENARLRDALEKYGWHSCDCEHIAVFGDLRDIESPKPCTCGLDAAKGKQ